MTAERREYVRYQGAEEDWRTAVAVWKRTTIHLVVMDAPLALVKVPLEEERRFTKVQLKGKDYPVQPGRPQVSISRARARDHEGGESPVTRGVEVKYTVQDYANALRELYPKTVAVDRESGAGVNLAWPAEGDTPGPLLYLIEDGRDRTGPRLHVSVGWPKSLDGGYMGGKNWGVVDYKAKDPEGSFAMNRAPNLVATEIGRRVVSPYLPLHKQAVGVLMDHRARHLRQRDAAVQLATVLGTRADESNGEHRVRWSNLPDNGGYGTFRVHGDSVTVELRSLTGEQALAVARGLAFWPTAQKGGG